MTLEEQIKKLQEQSKNIKIEKIHNDIMKWKDQKRQQQTRLTIQLEEINPNILMK